MDTAVHALFFALGDKTWKFLALGCRNGPHKRCMVVVFGLTSHVLSMIGHRNPNIIVLTPYWQSQDVSCKVYSRSGASNIPLMAYATIFNAFSGTATQ